MQPQVSWAMGKPGTEDLILSAQSDTEAYHGHLAKALDLSQHAVDSAKSNDAKETAAILEVNQALREAEFGNATQARQFASAALALAPGRDVQLLAASGPGAGWGCCFGAEVHRQVKQRLPLSTVLQRYWLPTVQAEIELAHGSAARAIEVLQAASTYESGDHLSFNLERYIRFMCVGRRICGQQTGRQRLRSSSGSLITVDRAELPPGRISACWLGPCLRPHRRHRQSESGLPGLLRPLERRRPRHPHPEGSQGGVREAAVAEKTLTRRILFTDSCF